MEIGSFRGVAVMDSVLESTMTSSKRSSSSRRGPIASPRWRTSSDTSGERPAREARLFTSAASAEMEELGGKGIKRRIGAAPGGVTVTVYRSIGTWDMVRRVRERNGEGLAQGVEQSLDYMHGGRGDYSLKETFVPEDHEVLKGWHSKE